MRGNTDQRDSHYFLITNRWRRWMQPLLADDRQFRESSLSLADALAAGPNAITRFEACHVMTNFDNRAGQVAADNVRKGKAGLDGAAADVSINRVDIDCANLNETF